jgi:hypothetical protein
MAAGVTAKLWEMADLVKGARGLGSVTGHGMNADIFGTAIEGC